jgi:RNA polymerase sigma-70 factor (sigma-E family)
MPRTPTTARDAEFSEFMRSASASLGRTAWLLTGDADRADELVQAALVKTYLAWPRVRHAEALPYARRILVNLNVDSHRRSRTTPSDRIEGPAPVDAEAGVDHRDQATRMLAVLPLTQRRVIVLRYYHDLSEREVAECLGMSVGAVKSSASRGLAAIRAHFVPAGEGER